MTQEWDHLLSEFRSLGGIAENIYQKEGEIGRGIFSINPNIRSKIFTPSNLMIKKEDICLEDNQLRIQKHKSYSEEIRHFFNYYQDNFSWGGGGKETTESFEKGLSLFPDNLKILLKDYMLFDVDKRHKGEWENILKQKFLNARSFKFNGDSYIVPILDLVNHEAYSLPIIKTVNGLSTPNYCPREGEMTMVYGSSGSLRRVFNYGFFCREPIVFSLPFSLNFRDSELNFICKGLDLKDDKIIYKSIDSQIIIDGIPIASIKKKSFIKNYFEHLLELTNLKNIPQDIFSTIVSYNCSKRKEILGELKLIDNYSSRLISRSINYELDSISQL